ncbi:MAG: acetylxylan esterase [Clostridia bacterium]|nr:acetylxylan esterase [Clostridia bacterium]
MSNAEYIKPDLCHEEAIKLIEPKLKFDASRDFDGYRAELRAKFLELLGDMPEKVPANVRVEYTEDRGDFTEKRFIFDTEKYASVPCHLWIPKDGKEKHGVVICLQGHSSGMHISMGRALYDGDDVTISGGDRDFARQIVKEGYAALVLEQRAFGERRSDKMKDKTTCPHPSMVALLIGRTMVGERVWDVSRAIDALESFPEIDAERVAVMGNSGGGTCSFYAACFDERIKIAMPSCAVCTYRDSIAAMYHCACNYIPNAAKYFDMGDLAALIAPRPLVMVCGREDKIFPLRGVMETYGIVEEIYKKAGAAENCKLVIGEGGHRFYADPSWDIFGSFGLI